jgi:retinol dehydrogenase-12
MNPPICLITGATDGVGKVTALELARQGFKVVMAVRSAAKAEAVKRELAGAGDLEHIVADLASLAQVRRLADAFRQRHARLDVLINNAGVFLPERSVTEDGFETTFQVNYLSAFLLTQLLQSELEQSTQGRIINLSSSVYAFGKFDPENLQSEKRFSVFGTYASSKLWVLMFTLELARRLSARPVTANAVHPGIVRTPMMLRAPGAFRFVSYLSLPFSVSAKRGAQTSLYLAQSPDVRAVSGGYFAGAKRRDVKSAFLDGAHRERLWDLSIKAIGNHGRRS